MSTLGRFVIDLSGNLVDWDIYPTTGQIHSRAHLMGDALEEITRARARA
jgi:hypothetical protein